MRLWSTLQLSISPVYLRFPTNQHTRFDPNPSYPGLGSSPVQTTFADSGHRIFILEQHLLHYLFVHWIPRQGREDRAACPVSESPPIVWSQPSWWLAEKARSTNTGEEISQNQHRTIFASICYSWEDRPRVISGSPDGTTMHQTRTNGTLQPHFSVFSATANPTVLYLSLTYWS